MILSEKQRLIQKEMRIMERLNAAHIMLTACLLCAIAVGCSSESGNQLGKDTTKADENAELRIELNLADVEHMETTRDEAESSPIAVTPDQLGCVSPNTMDVSTRSVGNGYCAIQDGRIYFSKCDRIQCAQEAGPYKCGNHKIPRNSYHQSKL